MGKLEGKVAVVTGAGQGTGRAITKVFAAEGAKVVFTEIVATRLAESQAYLQAFGANVRGVQADASVKAEAERAVQIAVDAFGRLDVVVNVAQAYRPAVMVEDIDMEVLKLTFGSFLGTLNHMQAALPHLKASKGSIVNFGSFEGINPGELGLGAYAAAKEAIRGISRAAAREWGKYGIRVNVIHPNSLSPSAIEHFKTNPGFEATLTERTLLKRSGDPEADIAPVAVFLASDDSRYVTGQTIGADGMTMF